MANHPDNRDNKARQADLDWLYAGAPPAASDSQPRGANQSPRPDSVRTHDAAQHPKSSDSMDFDPLGDDVQRLDLSELRAAAKQSKPATQNVPRSGEPTPTQRSLRSGEQPKPAPSSRPRVTPQPSPEPTPASKTRPANAAQSAAAEPAAPRTRPARSRRRPRPIRTARRIIRTIFLLLLAWLVFLVAVPVRTLAAMTDVQATPAGKRPPRQPGTALLLVGTDSREGLSAEERERLGTGDAAGHRADTIMLLYKPRQGRSVLISLPRDSYVQIPDVGQTKLNAAYAIGGPQLLQHTVEQNTGVRVDGYLEIGFGGFANLVDAVNGVEVCLDAPMQDDLAHIDLPAGCQTLDGAQALGYVRMRYSDPRGDLGRAERQREVISKVADKVAKPATVINPVRYRSVNKAVGQTMAKSDDTGNGDLLAAGLAVLDIAKGEGLSLQVPIANPSGWTADGQSVVIWDDQGAAEMFGEVAAGDTSRLERFA